MKLRKLVYAYLLSLFGGAKSAEAEENTHSAAGVYSLTVFCVGG